MTQSAYANATINNMLGWLKGFATWVLRLFNLAGRGNFSPLAWLSENWLQLLVILLIAGFVTDLVVWLIRWRPYWVWFRKKRILIEDENFFASEEQEDDDDPDDLFDRELFGDSEPEEEEERPRRRPRSRESEGTDEFVVASTIVHRAGPRVRDTAAHNEDRDKHYRRPSTIVTREVQPSTPAAQAEARDSAERDDIFGTAFDNRAPAVQWDEDDVFNVSDLPISEQPEDFEPKSSRKRGKSASDR